MLKQTLVLGLLTLSGLYSAHAQEVLTLEKALNKRRQNFNGSGSFIL